MHLVLNCTFPTASCQNLSTFCAVENLCLNFFVFLFSVQFYLYLFECSVNLATLTGGKMKCSAYCVRRKSAQSSHISMGTPGANASSSRYLNGLWLHRFCWSFNESILLSAHGLHSCKYSKLWCWK